MDNEGLPRISKKEIDIYKDWAQERLYITAPEKLNFLHGIGLSKNLKNKCLSTE